MPLNSWKTGSIVVCLIGIGACGSIEGTTISTLHPPGGTTPEAMSAMQKGNQAFAAGQWTAAGKQYKHVIQVQPKLAEAHYNLALTLDKLGHHTEADNHYIQAANLAPGHSVIWNSRKFRRYGDVTVKQKSGGSTPVLPGLGGLGGGR